MVSTLRSTVRAACGATLPLSLALTLAIIGCLLGAPPARAQYAPPAKDAPATPPAKDAGPSPAAKSAAAAPPAEGKPIFQVQRIELSLFAGPFFGATYLQLPDIFDVQRTRDLGASDILDFSGRPLRAADSSPIRAPHKKLENGTLFGGAATFYLSDRFGLELRGVYGKTQATVTGHTDRNPTVYEWDRSNVSVYQGGANMVYQVSRGKLRPYFNLGFGGILNNYPRTRDVGALYFLWGGGLHYPLSPRLSAQLSVDASLYSYKNNEIIFNETITLPMISAGLTWRHDVPPAPAVVEPGNP
jgi:hypothetical protein